MPPHLAMVAAETLPPLQGPRCALASLLQRGGGCSRDEGPELLCQGAGLSCYVLPRRVCTSHSQV